MVVTDKTADEDFFLLTLVAVAKELKTRGLHHNAVVILGAGVPFKRFGEEAGKISNEFLAESAGMQDFALLGKIRKIAEQVCWNK